MGAPYRYERAAWRSGLEQVAGVDEAGRGPLAGPVVAAAVILDPNRRVKGLDDSKRLAPARRERLFEQILEHARGVGVGIVDPQTIDRVNILEATRRAMYEALGKLTPRPDLVLIDALRLPALACPQKPLVHGDSRPASLPAPPPGATPPAPPPRPPPSPPRPPGIGSCSGPPPVPPRTAPPATRATPRRS